MSISNQTTLILVAENQKNRKQNGLKKEVKKTLDKQGFPF